MIGFAHGDRRRGDSSARPREFTDEIGIRNSFWLPVVCLVVIAIHGFRPYRHVERA